MHGNSVQNLYFVDVDLEIDGFVIPAGSTIFANILKVGTFCKTG